MPATLVERAPRVRCYECGSNEIFSVCHHCQKPMCKEHSPLAYLAPEPGRSADEAKPASREFAGLKLGGTKEAVYHCKEHAHTVRGGLIGLIIRMFQGSAASAARPSLPLVPHVNTVDVLERLSGNVRFENGTYTSTVETVAGEIKVNMSANDGRRLLQLYRKKYRLPDSQPVSFVAGFVVLEGEAGLEFLPGQQAALKDRTGVSMGGDSADNHDLFPADPGRTQGEWTLKAAYEL